MGGDQHVGHSARGDEDVVDSEYGLLRLHHAADAAEVMAHWAAEAGEGGLHGLPEHVTGRRSQAIGHKLQGFLAVEAELPEDGLATYGDDRDDLDRYDLPALLPNTHPRLTGTLLHRSVPPTSSPMASAHHAYALHPSKLLLCRP